MYSLSFYKYVTNHTKNFIRFQNYIKPLNKSNKFINHIWVLNKNTKIYKLVTSFFIICQFIFMSFFLFNMSFGHTHDVTLLNKNNKICKSHKSTIKIQKIVNKLHIFFIICHFSYKICLFFPHYVALLMKNNKICNPCKSTIKT